MTWFGGPTHIAFAAAVCVAALLLDRLLLRAGVIEHNHRRVSHRKLRAAAAARRKPAAGTSAPSMRPAAGTQLQAGDSRLDRGAADGHPSVQPHPAPSDLPRDLGAGPLPLTAVVNPPTGDGQAQPACTGDPRYPVQAGVPTRPAA